MFRITTLALLLFSLQLSAQKQITLADLYKKGTFRGEAVRASFDTSGIQQQRMYPKEWLDKDGKSIGYPDEIITAAADARWLLIKVGEESIYRRSSKAIVYLYNSATKAIYKLSDEKILHPSFSPDGKKVAYVKNNNLFIYDIASQKTKAITTDGKWNYIINGNCDWVYEEEFEFSQAYQWSPQGTYIAYYRFDESKVKEYSITTYNNNYNQQYTYKYPKAGEENSTVSIHIYDVAKGKQVKAQVQQGDIYIPRIRWSAADNQLVVYWMNRHQNQLKLLLTNAATGVSKIFYEETNKYFVEINDDWWFLKDGAHFLFVSEKDGYRNVYLYSIDGKRKTAVTTGKYDIAEINGVDENRKRIYYTAAYPTPMDRAVFVTDFDGKNTVLLTSETGYNQAIFNKDFTRFYNYFSTLTTPQKVTLNSIAYGSSGITVSSLQTITENAKLQALLKEYSLPQGTLIKVPNGKGDSINGWMLKPAHFDATKKYPVLFCNYGGPGSQQVTNRYGAISMWHQLLAQKGCIVVCFDNTGTGFRGEAFKKKTYLQLGKYEIEDQIAAAKWLADQPYVDKKNIGHWGWSFGGFMSSLAITKGAGIFSAAVAVAPVTNWRFYDNIYTERYMRTPKENPEGYDQNSPINFTDQIKGKYLLIHGMADDNVHFQNATQMVTALVKSNVPFESAYYPNKDHGISGGADNTTLHLWTHMTNWILQNLGNEHTDKTVLQ